MHWIIISLPILLTFFAWSYTKSQLEARTKNQFERETEQVVELILERMKKYEDALWGGVALVGTLGGDIDYDSWKNYANSIELEQKYPGINGIGVIHALTEGELPPYLAAQRQLRPDYHIHPAREASDFYPISYIIPVEGNERAVGLDIAHETNRRTAVRKARDSGEARITGPITLVQDSSKTPGFLLYAPYYEGGKPANVQERRSRFSGMIYAPFVVKKLMRDVLEKERRHVGIRLVDGEDTLYDEHVSTEPDYDPDPLFRHEMEIPVYGRTWTFDIWSTQSFRRAAANHLPLTILISGLAIDGLLVLLFFSISRASQKALRYADSMTFQLESNAEKLRRHQELLALHAQQLKESNRALERSEKRFRATLESSPTAMILVSHEGKVVLMNTEVEKLFGYSRGELLGKPIETLVPERFRQNHPHQRDSFFANPSVRRMGGGRDLTALRKDGSELYVEIGLNPVETEEGRFVLCAIVDVTGRKRSEKRMRKANRALAQSNSELQQFAYVASHDLQEPLRKISAYAQLLREEYGQQLDEEGRQYLNVVTKGAERLKVLISDLLSFSRINTRGRPLVPTDANQCLQVALEQLELTIDENDAQITWDHFPSVLADSSQLILLFQNLLKNAIKYKSEATPEVHVGGRDLGKQFEFAIRDNGIGIDPQFHERIFQIFQRLHNSREYSGTGIGLASCKRIVQRFNGQMRVESALGAGSTFYFTLNKSNCEKRHHDGTEKFDAVATN